MKVCTPILAAIFLLTTLLTIGCATSSLSGSVYSRDQAKKTQTVRKGTVIYVREVQIEGTRSGFGAVAGGALGYVLGGTVGSGSGETIAKTVGGVGGAIAGSKVEDAVTRQVGLEISVELEDGSVVAIVQAADKRFEVGDSVRILSGSDGTARVVQ